MSWWDDVKNNDIVKAHETAFNPFKIGPDSGYVGKENKSPNTAGLVAEGEAAGTAFGERIFGQTLDQTGQGIQRGIKGIEANLDPNTNATVQAMMQQKQQSQANVARNFAGRKIAGGVAAAGVEQAGRQKDIDIAASAYQQNTANLKNYTNLQSNIAANQGSLIDGAVASRMASVRPTVPQQPKGFLQEIIS